MSKVLGKKDKTVIIQDHKVEEIPQEYTYECTLCDLEFTCLETHLKEYHQDDVVSFEVEDDTPIKDTSNHCKICNTHFETQKSLALHSKIHKSIKNKNIHDLPEFKDLPEMKNLWMCPICHKLFKKDLLLIHEKSHLDTTETSFLCKICNKEFETDHYLEMHYSAHNEDNGDRSWQMSQMYGNGKGCGKYKCKYCDKAFQRPYQKVKHEMIHTGEKPYTCDVCGKTFRIRNCLTIHLRTHMDVKGFICEVCNKGFKSRSAYKHHQQTHSSETKYKCGVCDKAFKTAVMLGNHKKIHTKPYKCGFCDRKFSTLYAVKSHMVSHNSESEESKLRLECEFCSARYGKKFSLEKHRLEEHPNEFIEVDHEVEGEEEYVVVVEDIS